MRKNLPLFLVLALLLAGGFYLARRAGSQHRFDERVTLRRDDRIPYGTYLAREALPKLFPNAYIYNEPEAPGHWDSLATYESRQAIVLVGYYINADNDEVSELMRFASHGNYVYIIGVEFSDALGDALRISTEHSLLEVGYDSMEVRLEAPRFAGRSFHYPGTDRSGALVRQAPDSTVLLGTRGGSPNFLQFRVGKGAVFFHSSPLTFSNYFLLQPGNEDYLSGALSVLPPDLRRVAWSEYYLSKDDDGKDSNNSKGWLSVLFQYRSFAWALWLFLLLVVLYAASEMRRRQRWIPPYERPQNDSLDFVETVGRLYYDQRDHYDLAGKMIQYFLDHVRQQYKIPTMALDEEFVRRLEARSGYPRASIERLLALVADIRAVGRASEQQLTALYQQLENYYQHG